MRFVYYSDWSQLPESGSELLDESAKNSIFYSRFWFENVTTTVDKSQTLLLACVLAQGKVLAILPLISSDGSNWQSLKHHYGTHYNVLVAGVEKTAILTCLADGLRRISVKSLLLEPVSDEEGDLIQFQHIMEKTGYHCQHTFRLYNWIHRLQGQSYEDYIAARPARLRNTISRKKRKLTRDHGFDIRLFTGDQVPHAMHDYYLVYNASWKANEQYVNFMSGIVAGFSSMGWSRLAVLYIKSRPVAAQLWFVHHGKANIFRLAYDEAWRQYSPGSILMDFLIEYVIHTDRVAEIDFLTGNEAYKQDWMSERRERYALSCISYVQPVSKIGQCLAWLQSFSIK